MKICWGALEYKGHGVQEQARGLGVLKEQPVWQELRERREEDQEVGANGDLDSRVGDLGGKKLVEKSLNRPGP